MDIRSTQSRSTSGLYSDPRFLSNPNLEGVSLTWDALENKLVLTDININYNTALYTNFFKKAIITYNGYNKTANYLLETLVYQSDNSNPASLVNNSTKANFWEYIPSQFKVEDELRTTTNPLDFATQPYDYTQGFTVVKQFLTNQSNASMQVDYTALYRSPILSILYPVNVVGKNVFTDGWYTSYIILTPTIEYARSLYTNSIPKGTIVYDPTSKNFFINTTGADLNAPVLTNEPENWSTSISLEQWQSFLRDNLDAHITNNLVLFVETQHLVLPDLFLSIENTVLNGAVACNNGNYGLDVIDTWVRLSQKASAAQIFFNNENYSAMQKIIESSRSLCSKCLTDVKRSCKTC
jgi:hypothetical protein